MRPSACARVVLLLGAAASSLLAADPPSAADGSPVRFVAHRLGRFRSEALGVADFNRDGRLDIAAGPHLYLAPGWTAQTIRAVSGTVDENGKGYVDDFMNVPIDVDGDGWIDLVSCGWFCKCVRWHRNPAAAGGIWPEQIADTGANHECGERVDLDGDGKAREIFVHTGATVWYEPGPSPSGGATLVKHVIATNVMSYGGGVGDLNGDGRPDVLRPDAWFAAPADPRAGAWTRHAWALGAPDGKADHTPQMLVYDVNADGRADVITSSAHKHGIFWYEQARDGDTVSWRQHVIDDTWSQAHSFALADLDGDGTPDLVTGKRFMAHNGSDPDESGKLGVYWYALSRGPSPKWTRHILSFDEGIGSGVNLWAGDLDGDGDADVVVTGKWGGPVWFENQGRRGPRT